MCVCAQEKAYERESSASRFHGSSSISSAEYFGTPTTNNNHAGFSVSAPDLDDVSTLTLLHYTILYSRLVTTL